MARRRAPLTDVLWAFAVYVCRLWDIALPADLRSIIARQASARKVIYRRMAKRLFGIELSGGECRRVEINVSLLAPDNKE